MTDRYFKKEWGESYYIFDSETITEKEVDEAIEYDNEVFSQSMTGEEVLDRLNQLTVSNERWQNWSKKDSELIKKLRKTIHELRVEVKELETFKKILEFAEKDMEERADWQAYCEKEFGGL